MITITSETVVERPVEELFAFIADPTNDPRWCPPVLEAEQVAGNGPEKGARFRQVVRPGPKQLINMIEIVEYAPNRRMAWRGSNGMMAFHGHYHVESTDGGARVAMRSHLQLKGIWRLLAPVVAFASRQTAAKEFQNLKRLLESGPGLSRARPQGRAV